MIRVCDVCEAPAAGDPIKFGWGSAFYETDLCKEHAKALVSVVEATIKTARRLGAKESKVAPVRRPTVKPSEVRAWAKKKRIRVNPTGRVPEAVVEQYLAETRPA